ncbi:hypothetical protein LPB86_08645 [Pedobacter sp. MC2016-14]|uniref:hypothetical protein n=1 Tax=Pedobacter sp. MC2016-14 TaxID=2897327 RepID=UPI001E57049D|nr:hypothetical protein [Pedobacter sp. MC2016-14]MCD0488295.1 hypothetical protein [Pedobacter sp. MC2016-14]
MRHTNKHLKLSVLLLFLSMAFMACNKENIEAEKAMQIIVNGYNGGSTDLEMSVDTTLYGTGIANGGYLFKPGSIMGASIAYKYAGQKERMFTLTETGTKKVLLSRPLPATGTKAMFNFIYLDGKELEINPPTSDANINKLGFYVQYTDSDAPFDVFLYRRDNTTGQEYRHYLVKNLRPKTWIYFDYIAAPDFGSSSLLGNSSIHFTKAGTTDQWAFEDNEALSKYSAASMSFPLSGEKGLVQPYFFAHNFGLLNRSRLFFYPDRQW